MKDIKVSVIVPMYKKEQKISKCLDSLINQTLREIEIVVVDDGSKDNSAEIFCSLLYMGTITLTFISFIVLLGTLIFYYPAKVILTMLQYSNNFQLQVSRYQL